MAAIEQGRAPRAVALDLIGRTDSTGRRTGGIIGLTSRQAEYVRNAREQLLNQDPAYFTRGRRDKKYDALVRKAFAAGKAPAQADIDKITARYSDRLLQLRGETIARTEGINAYRAGNIEAYRQMVDSGAVREDQLAREWDSTLDSRTRLQHMAMEGVQVRGLTQPFTMPDGTQMMHPGDASRGAGADQIINCRCFMKVKLKLL
jgi:Phage Mu protein F like protein